MHRAVFQTSTWLAPRRKLASNTPTSLLLTVGLIFAVLQFAPGVGHANGVVGTYLFAPLATTWLVFTLLTNRPQDVQATTLVVAIAAFSTVSLVSATDPDAGLVWWNVLLAPLCIFLGIQWVNERELEAARRALRLVLLLTSAVQVVDYFARAGLRVLSPQFVFGHHSDVAWWADVGAHTLGNPNNASPIFCAGFAWAVAERALGQPGRFSLPFLGLTGLSVWVTGSRGAIATAVLIVVIALGLRRRTRWLLWLGAAGCVAMLTVPVDWAAEIGFATTGLNESAAKRWGARLAAVPVILLHPFGSGIGSTAATLRESLFFVFRTDYHGATSHDLFLNWGVDLGWVGLVLLVLAIWVAFQRGVAEGEWLPMFPLIGFLVAGESAGLDILSANNPAWSATLWGLLALAWRGRVISSERRTGADVPVTARVAPLGDRLAARERRGREVDLRRQRGPATGPRQPWATRGDRPRLAPTERRAAGG